MDERQHDHADALDFDDYVLVFPDTLHVSLVTFIYAADYPYMLVLLEITFAKYFAFSRVGCSEKSQKVD